MIKVDATEVVEEIDGLMARARNLRPALDRTVDDFHTLMASGFATGGTAIGRRWAVNVPGWAAQKPGRPVGVFDGILAGSLTRRQAQHAIADIGPTTARLGSSAPHAALFDRGRGGQRSRRLEPSEGLLASRWIPIVQDHLDGNSSSTFDGII